MKTFSLSIVTPDNLVFEGEAEGLIVKTREGDVEILAGHCDLIAAVGTGRAVVKADGTRRTASCSGGLLTVAGGKVSLLPTTFEFKEDIDLQRAIEAKRRAEEAAALAKGDEAKLAIAKAKLMRAISRINVANGKY
ncbi:MAG: ATP synthase F1 subunit epsilon [Clostridia bacterium]|nr:ATP synthase F1 subunit epsilon [Clostridia bacterium]